MIICKVETHMYQLEEDHNIYVLIVILNFNFTLNLINLLFIIIIYFIPYYAIENAYNLEFISSSNDRNIMGKIINEEEANQQQLNYFIIIDINL